MKLYSSIFPIYNAGPSSLFLDLHDHHGQILTRFGRIAIVGNKFVSIGYSIDLNCSM